MQRPGYGSRLTSGDPDGHTMRCRSPSLSGYRRSCCLSTMSVRHANGPLVFRVNHNSFHLEG